MSQYDPIDPTRATKTWSFVQNSDGTLSPVGTANNPTIVAGQPIKVVDSNSSTTPLGANESFTGKAVDCSATPVASVVVFAIASQDGMLLVQWSQDALNWTDHIQAANVTAGDSAIVTDSPRSRYFRVVYTNGSTTQVGGYFRLQTFTSSTTGSGTVRDLDTVISGDDEALTTRSVITGRANGTAAFTDVATDVYGSLQTVIAGQAADAFGRVRVSNPVSLFDAKFQYSTKSLWFVTSVTGTGSVAKTSGESSITLSTGGTANNAAAINQTKQYLPYEPGKSQQILMTGLLGSKVTNVRSEIGYYDASNGVFFRMDGWANGTTSNSVQGACIVQRSNTSGSVVDMVIPQASWNFDRMDGTGPSGVTLDFSKTQIFAIDFQWLGVGRVRFGFFVNGVLLICHQINNANSVSSPYMNTACLPCRASIANAASGVIAGTNTMKQICLTVVSEGGTDQPGAYIFGASNAGTIISGIGATRVPLISIRPAATFNSLTNRTYIQLSDFDVYDQSAPTGYWELVYNGALTGGAGTWVAADSTYSAVEYNVDRTGCSGGVVLACGYVSGGGKVSETVSVDMRMPLALDISGSNPDVLTLCIRSTDTNIAAGGAIRWKEIR